MNQGISIDKIPGNLSFFQPALKSLDVTGDGVLNKEDGDIFSNVRSLSQIIGGGTDSILYKACQMRFGSQGDALGKAELRKVLTWFETDGRQVPDGGPRIVTIWSHEGAEIAAVIKIVQSFNAAHDDVQASLRVIPDKDNSYAIVVEKARLAGKLPDVLDVDGPFVAQFASSGILQPIDRLVSEAALADFLPSIIDQGTYEGNLYTLGAFESGLALMYNKGIIDEAFLAQHGLTLPEGSEDALNWDQFVAVLKAVRDSKPGVIPLSLNMGWGPGEWFTYGFLPIIWSTGQEVMSEDGRVTTGYLNSPKAIEAMREFQALFVEGLTTDSKADSFKLGNAAFTLNGHWMIDLYSNKKGIDLGIIPLPYMGEPADRAVATGSWCWGMTPNAEDKDVAATLLSWMVDPDHGVTPIVKANHAVPARMSAIRDLPDDEGRAQKVFVHQLKHHGHVRPKTPHYGIFTEEFAAAVKRIAAGEDPEVVLNEAAAKIDDRIAQLEKK